MIRVFAKLIAVVVACGLLSSCAGLVPTIGTPPKLYTLSPKSSFRNDLPQSFYQLIVEEPVAAQGINSDRIGLLIGSSEFAYYAGARWVERVPQLMQTLLVESFENSNRLEAVSRQSIGLRADFSVKSELREFQAEYADGLGKPPLIRVRLNVKVIREQDSRIVASRSVESTTMATDDNIPAIIIAFDDVLGKVLRRTVEWTVETLVGQADAGIPASVGRPRRLTAPLPEPAPQ